MKTTDEGSHNDSPVFIVGCPRSGTSLLRDLLRSHPRLTFPPETFFIPTFYKAYGDPKDRDQAQKLAAKILSLHWVKPWARHLNLSPAVFAGERSYRGVVKRLFEAWAQKENKPRWGDKTPYYVTDLPVLVKLFPVCKIIHIYRDGRDVAMSWLKFQPNAKNIYTSACLWKYFVSEGRRVGKGLPRENYYEVRYERLLENPVETMKDICHFLGETYVEAVTKPNFFENPSPEPLLGHWERKKWVSESEIVCSNRGKWKRNMPEPDQVLFESVAGDLLASLGYETKGRTRSVWQLERAFHQSHNFFWHLFQRVNQKTFFESLPGSIEMVKAKWITRWKDRDGQKLKTTSL